MHWLKQHFKPWQTFFLPEENFLLLFLRKDYQLKRFAIKTSILKKTEKVLPPTFFGSGIIPCLTEWNFVRLFRQILALIKSKPQILVVAVAELDVLCTLMLRDFDFRYYKHSVAGWKKRWHVWVRGQLAAIVN